MGESAGDKGDGGQGTVSYNLPKTGRLRWPRGRDGSHASVFSSLTTAVVRISTSRVDPLPAPPPRPMHNTGSPRAPPHDPPSAPSNPSASPTVPARHSPVAPLAPLEFLQNQRRGSITDPSLHAGPAAHSHMTNSAALGSGPSSFRRLNSPPLPAFSVAHDHPPRGPFAPPHPASSFRFGDASALSSESKAHSRRPQRSSSADGKRPALADETRRESEGGPERSPSGSREDGAVAGASGRTHGDRMDVDSREHKPEPREQGGSRHLAAREAGQAGYSARRHSIAAGPRASGLLHDRHLPSPVQGIKRKMSPEAGVQSPGMEDMDGPGSGMETEGPAPKRRGSAIDTQKIAQLSLYDRRNSVDARGGGRERWGGERRDTTHASAGASSSASASTPMAASGYSTPPSGVAGELPHGRPPGGIATFAWPANPQHPDQASPMQNEPNVNMAGPPHSYDPLSTMPPVSFAQDRRMSAPAISPENLPSPPSTGPSRVLRSRSRPPSRVRAADQSPFSNPAGPSSAPVGDDAAAQQALKESGSTPYSRSPELRVSHKLAERKRRKEMKELFDELRDQLPADRGMKASKWEILSKAIDFIMNLKQSHQEMGREIEMLRHELDSIRHGMPPPPFPPGPPQSVVYAHGPPVGVQPYPHPGPPGAPPPLHQGPPPPHQAPPHHQPPTPHQPLPSGQPPHSRPGSSQNIYPPGPGPMGQPPNANNGASGVQIAKTDPSS